jgi:hypothetical protein
MFLTNVEFFICSFNTGGSYGAEFHFSGRFYKQEAPNGAVCFDFNREPHNPGSVTFKYKQDAPNGAVSFDVVCKFKNQITCFMMGIF